MTKLEREHVHEVLKAIGDFLLAGHAVHAGALIMDDDRTIAEHVMKAIVETQG